MGEGQKSRKTKLKTEIETPSNTFFFILSTVNCQLKKLYSVSSESHERLPLVFESRGNPRGNNQ